MTCIVGLVHQGKVFIGADSLGGIIETTSVTSRLDRKVFRNGEFLMGFTSSFRMGQVLRYAFTPPPRDPKTDLEAYMVTSFVDGIRTAFKTAGFARKDHEEESGGTFLVGHAGRLFKIEGDYQVGESRDGFDACGCGEDFALGAMEVLKGEPRARIKRALAVAEKRSGFVRGPFIVESI